MIPRLAIVLLLCSSVLARDWYVSIERGKGKVGTMEQPAKDLGNIVELLAPGDVVHIAAGIYLGRGECGSDVIKVPVSILGGYAPDFSSRDPWGKHRTILAGNNGSANWVATPRLHLDLNLYRQSETPAIVVDGVIIDHAGRNHYAEESRLKLVRKANPKSGANPTPDQGALVITASKTQAGAWDISVRNCVILNAAPTQGALSVAGHKDSRISLVNNLVINNTGVGIFLGSKFSPSDKKGLPAFHLENNTVLFTWKYDPIAQSYSGNAVEVDGNLSATLKGNVLAFADRFGLNNAKKARLLLQDNVITGCVVADYLEFSTAIGLDDLEDEAGLLDPASAGNLGKAISVPVDKAWSQSYASRVLVDRNAMEADIKVQATRANELRAMLGLPLQAGTVDGPESPVWLHAMELDQALACAIPYHGMGARKP